MRFMNSALIPTSVGRPSRPDASAIERAGNRSGPQVRAPELEKEFVCPQCGATFGSVSEVVNCPTCRASRPAPRRMAPPASLELGRGGMTAAIFRFLAWCNLAGGALLVLNALSGGTVLLPKVPILEGIIRLLIS